MTLVGRFLPLGLAAAILLAPAPASAARRILPSWVIGGAYSVPVSPGFASLAGSYSFPLADGSASLTLNYDDRGRLAGSGFANVRDASGFTNVTNYSLVGTYSVNALTGVQSVRLADSVKSPQFVFDGEVSADANDIVGTSHREDGFLGIVGEESGPLTIHRTSGPARTTFLLVFKAVMDAKGRVRGALSDDGRSETKAEVTVYGTRFDEALGAIVDIKATGGKVRGLVKTSKFAETTGTLTITGKGWKAKLTGPIDQDGFHATVDFTGLGFTVRGATATLAVTVGAPPPIPPPPKNLLLGAQATIVNGKVTITHANLPSKFFGPRAGLSIEFPAADGQAIVNGHSIVHADPAAASIPDPDARRCTVTIAGRAYGTTTAPGDVTLDIRKMSFLRTGHIEVLATGTVVASNGRKKPVNVLVDAVVQ